MESCQNRCRGPVFLALIPLRHGAGILNAVTLSTKTLDIAADSPYLGRRIDHLVQELVVLPRAQVTGLFDHGCVRRNGVLCQTPGERLSTGDRIEIAYDVHRRYHPKPRVRRNLGFQIVFEDQHLIVVIKPAELLTVPTSRGETNTLQNKVEEYVRHVSKGRGAFTVHRLDRGVSGLLVFGKSEAIVRELKDQFAASKPEREYVAIVAGALEQEAGTFESLLATGRQFYAVGAAIALVLGGSQALSRSLFSLMIPKGQETEYFSLYEISERGTSWMGPLLFGLAIQVTDSYRVAVLSVGVFFIAGLILLPLVNVRKAIAEAGNEAPEVV